MPKFKLTKSVIDDLPECTNRSGVRYFDTVLDSFGIRVYPSGKKTFFIMYGPQGRRRQFTIGDWGVLTLKEARKRARKELVKVLDDRDPKAEKEEKRGRQTFNEWADTYYRVVSCTRKHPREDRRYLGIAKKAFGNKLLEEITPTDVQEVFDKRKDKPAVANRQLATIRACLNEACRKGFIFTNPAAKIQTLSPLEPRRRVLSDDEYKRLQKAVADLPNVFNRMAFLIMMETGTRMSEVLNAEWSHIDFDRGVWHIPRPKSGIPQSLPLTSSLQKSLEQMPRPGKYIIAGKDPDKPRYDLKSVWKRILKKAELSDVRIHDIRRTVGKQIALKHGLLAATKVLRHSDPRVTERHYTPLNDEELRSFLEDRNSELEKTAKPKE